MTARQLSIVDRIVALHEALAAKELPHAFGGALALAWCTQRARGTIDVDVNVFVPAAHSAEVLAALPAGVVHTTEDIARCEHDGQVRVWWDATPIDVFTNTTPFHEEVAQRAVTHRFAGRDLPFLCCEDLAVFKAFFNRPKDWVDLDEMWRADTLDVERVCSVLESLLGDDARVVRLRSFRDR